MIPSSDNTLVTHDYDTIKSMPGLLRLLPIIYIAWADAVLTSKEIATIRDLSAKQAWLTNEEKIIMNDWLDPANPPSPQQLKSWLSIIKQAAENAKISSDASLAEVGIKIAQKTAANGDEEATSKVHASLRDIENVLGIISSESFENLFATEEQEVATPSKKEASFDVKAMTALLDGEDADIIQKVKSIITRPEFAYVQSTDKNVQREQVLKWAKILAKEGLGAIAYPKEYGGEDDMRKYFAVMETLSYHDLSLVIKFGVQFGLFGMSVFYLGTKKHHKKYLKDIGTLALPGCFAMTEMGHGSNVRDIETTATYDKKKQEFIIHTPHEAAGKEYIGNAAVHGRMATVFAQLIINEVNYGVSALLVPIRDEKGNPLPNVRIEDCGEKMGLNGVDNGRLWFNQVRIPRENLLDRFASVSKEGVYESPINSDSRRFFVMLGTLVGGRIGIPRSGLSAAKSGLAIAIRYGDQRRQFGPPNKPEIPILDYKTHQRRLMPLLANAYALHFALQYLTRRFMQRTDKDSREIEALAAGLKAFATWNTTDTLQTCREACGGKGYLAENRIPALKADTDVYTTFEGDNTVLMQLVAKSRLTEFKQELQDINFFTVIKFISQQAKTKITELNPIIVRKTDEEHLRDPNFHLSAFRYRERNILTSAARRFKHRIDEGMDSFEAFNDCQYHFVQAAFAYVERVVIEQFVEAVENCEDEELKAVLKQLCDLFALWQIEKNKGWYLEQGYLEGVKTKAIRNQVNQLCAELRQDAVALVDAFAIPDSCLAAPIAT